MKTAGMLLGFLLLAGAAGAADSDEQVAHRLFRSLLEPVAEAARSSEAGGVAVRSASAASPPAQSFAEAVGDHLLATGLDVWVIGPGQAVPEGVLVLDLELTASEIDYPRQTRSFLGVGAPRIQRRVALGASMRLRDHASGRVLYAAEPVRVREEWMSYEEASGYTERRPGWIGANPIEELRAPNPWWQRALVTGIVGGVAVLYFGGAN